MINSIDPLFTLGSIAPVVHQDEEKLDFYVCFGKTATPL